MEYLLPAGGSHTLATDVIAPRNRLWVVVLTDRKVLDQQLQMGILMALKKLGVDTAGIAEYRIFMDKEFPEVPEELRVEAEVRAEQR